MSTDTPLDLDAIRVRVDAATGGPWSADQDECNVRTADGRALVNVLLGDDDTREAPWQALADIAFIAAARSDLPALLAELKRQRPVLEAVKALHELDQDWADPENAWPISHAHERLMAAFDAYVSGAPATKGVER